MNLEYLKEILVLGFQFDENNVVEILINPINPWLSNPREKYINGGEGEERGRSKNWKKGREEAVEGSSFLVGFVFF